VNVAIYVIFVLLSSVICVSFGYGINKPIAASAIVQQSSSSIVSEQHSSGHDDDTIIQQSSDQSQSTSSSNSVVIQQNSGSGGVSSSSRIVSSTGGDLRIDMQSSGKIASSQLNLTSGKVESVLFGNWSLNGPAGQFIANFTYRPENGTAAIEYEMNGLQPRSLNQINNSLVIVGTIDVASNGRIALQDVPVTIIIQNGILVVGFERGAEVSNLFGGIPIVGFEQ
jgi:hypothetical protein